jgi:L-amino acid N-acyltransferase YncA
MNLEGGVSRSLGRRARARVVSSSRCRPAAAPGSAAIACALLLLSPTVAASSFRQASSPQTGDFFEYKLLRKVGDGTGEYEGYWDELRSSGRYEITSIAGGVVSLTATYSWAFSSNYAPSESGTESRAVKFDAGSRKYVSPKTDLDDFDTMNASLLAVWFWAPPSSPVGAKVQVLDESYTVTARDSTVWTNWAPVLGMRAEGSGRSQRHDSYGDFSFNWQDTYHFDQASGYVVAIRYEEWDTGSYNGNFGSFKLTEEFDLTSASFPTSLDFVTIGGALAWVIGVIAFFLLAARAIRWRSRTFVAPGIGGVQVRRIRRMGQFPRGLNEASANFGGFLEDFGRKAFLAGDRVAIAVSPSTGKVLGLAIDNREARIGTILCQDSFVTEGLRRFLKVKDFFTESRHLIPESVMTLAASYGETMPTRYVYNVYETYQVLMLTPVPKVDYDRSLISRMRKEDLGEVEEVATKVHGLKARKWLRAQMDSGDVGFVARAGGRVAGFAFASYANGHGRVHTATVLQEHRGKGIGKELMRARLDALEALGADYVITEIADWNLASLQVATSFGFRKIGTMVVESSRSTKVKRAIVRR